MNRSLFEQPFVRDSIPISYAEHFGKKIWTTYQVVREIGRVATPDLAWIMGMHRCTYRVNKALSEGLIEKSPSLVWCARNTEMEEGYRVIRPALPPDNIARSHYEGIRSIKEAQKNLERIPFVPSFVGPSK